jgi:hypothetical protein
VEGEDSAGEGSGGPGREQVMEEVRENIGGWRGVEHNRERVVEGEGKRERSW